MFYFQCKQSVTFIDILGDSLVIWVTGFGKIRNIILCCFIFDGRGVSGMCVYDSFCPFRWLNRDCPLQWAVPFIGQWRYIGCFVFILKLSVSSILLWYSRVNYFFSGSENWRARDMRTNRVFFWPKILNLFNFSYNSFYKKTLKILKFDQIWPNFAILGSYCPPSENFNVYKSVKNWFI